MLPGAFPDSLRQALRAASGSDELRLVSARDGSGVKTPSELCVSFLTPQLVVVVSMTATGENPPTTFNFCGFEGLVLSFGNA
jgi:hypothetical protein